MFVRRLSAAALAGALAVAGLTGCRSDPAVAAYVGTTKITETEVDTAISEVTRLTAEHNEDRGRLSAQARAALGQDDPLGYEAVAPTREQVLSTLVFAEVCRQLPTGTGQPVEQPVEESATGQVARAERLPVASDFVRRRVGYYTCLSRFGAQAAPVTPSQEQLRNLYDRGVAAKVFDPAQGFAEVAPQLAANEQVRGAYGLRQTLVEAIEGRRLTVNPRYRPLELPILLFSATEAAVAVPLAVDPEPAVLDAG